VSTWSITISKQDTLRVGRLVKAHGLKGAFKLELYTDSPNERFTPGTVLELQVPDSSPWFGHTVTVSELRWYNQAPVLFLKEVQDRTMADSLVRAILLYRANTDELPKEKDAWYDYQLIGLKVLRDGVEIGVVERVDHLPAQDLLAVKADEKEVLVPFVKAFVPDVNMAAGTLTVTPPGGLFEDLAEED